MTRRPCCGSIQQNFSRRINMKIEFTSQRREVFLFLTTNIAAVTYKPAIAPLKNPTYIFLAPNTCLAFFSPPRQKTMQRQTVSSMPSFLSSSARAVRTSANLSGLHSNGILIFFHNQDKFHNTLRSLRAFQYHNLKPQKHLETAGAMFLGSCNSVPQ